MCLACPPYAISVLHTARTARSTEGGPTTATRCSLAPGWYGTWAGLLEALWELGAAYAISVPHTAEHARRRIGCATVSASLATAERNASRTSYTRLQALVSTVPYACACPRSVPHTACQTSSSTVECAISVPDMA
eukprot:2390193-Rhodomonas_salina.2